MMLTFRARKIIALAVFLALVAGCSREQQDWRSAEAADTVESYGQFLDRHPDSELATQARTRVAQLTEEREWQQASKADTADAYRQFLAQHPNDRWSQEARIRIQNFALNGLPPAGPPMATAVDAAPVTSTPGGAPSGTATNISSANSASINAPAGYGVQLGAFGSESAANKEWQQLTARFGEQLHGLTPRVVPANTTTGPLFRLQAQVADEAQARSLCDMLRKQSQPCVPVLPH